LELVFSLASGASFLGVAGPETDCATTSVSKKDEEA